MQGNTRPLRSPPAHHCEPGVPALAKADEQTCDDRKPDVEAGTHNVVEDTATLDVLAPQPELTEEETLAMTTICEAISPIARNGICDVACDKVPAFFRKVFGDTNMTHLMRSSSTGSRRLWHLR